MRRIKIALIILILVLIIEISIFALYIAQNSGKKKLLYSNSVTGIVSGVNISPTIYSPQNNLAILNEFSSFNFTAYNYSNETWNVIISIIANNDELFSDQFSVPNQSTISKVVHQELCYVGPWLIKAISNETRASTSYAFVTVANIQEADTQIKATENVQNQQNSANLANTISIIALIVSTITGVIAIVISILSYRRKR